MVKATEDKAKKYSLVPSVLMKTPPFVAGFLLRAGSGGY
jgi:hypothetical protein